MKKRVFPIFAMCVAMSATGCQSRSETSPNNSSVGNADATDTQPLDFEALLTSVDNAIGKRFQSMQMGTMESATYQYDGPIQKVLDIVAPAAKKFGFSKAASDHSGGMGVAEQEIQKRMGFEMKSSDHKMFTHPNGDTLMVLRINISNEDIDMKMLTIQLMNPKKMAEFGSTLKKP